jgi:CYTH domain-containing protein
MINPYSGDTTTRLHLPWQGKNVPWREAAAEAVEIRQWWLPHIEQKQIFLNLELGEKKKPTYLVAIAGNKVICKIKIPKLEMQLAILGITGATYRMPIGDARGTRAYIEKKGKARLLIAEMNAENDDVPLKIELELTKTQARKLSEYCMDRQIWKIRHTVQIKLVERKLTNPPPTATVDVFLKDNIINRLAWRYHFSVKAAGILIGTTLPQLTPDNMPAWFQEEVTKDPGYKHSLLAKTLTTGTKQQKEGLFPTRVTSNLPPEATRPKRLQLIH